MYNRVGSMIPFRKKKCKVELVTFEINVEGKKNDDIKSFLEVKIIRCDSSKQE
jgi:hypothetical protein